MGRMYEKHIHSHARYFTRAASLRADALCFGILFFMMGFIGILGLVDANTRGTLIHAASQEPSFCAVTGFVLES